MSREKYVDAPNESSGDKRAKEKGPERQPEIEKFPDPNTISPEKRRILGEALKRLKKSLDIKK